MPDMPWRDHQTLRNLYRLSLAAHALTMGHSPEGRGRGQTDIYKISPNNFFFPESSYIYVCQADSSLGLTKEFEKN